MIKILVIDDALEGILDSLRRDIAGVFQDEVEIKHINPLDHIARNGGVDTSELLNVIARETDQFLDLILIDINLYDDDVPEVTRISLFLDIVVRIREVNKSAMVILYTGTLAMQITKLLNQRSRGDNAVEQTLRKIFYSGVHRFVSRNHLGEASITALQEPPLILRVDRLLCKTPTLRCRSEESELSGKDFEQLAREVRNQSELGKRLSEIILKHGVSAVADLNA